MLVVFVRIVLELEFRVLLASNLFLVCPTSLSAVPVLDCEPHSEVAGARQHQTGIGGERRARRQRDSSYPPLPSIQQLEGIF